MAENDDESTLTEKGLEDFDNDLDDFTANADSAELEELLKTMNEQSIITWDEAERVLAEGPGGVVKSGLPEHVRPDEPDNDTDVDKSISRLNEDDPTLTDINLNNMKRTPFVQIAKIINAAKHNTNLKKLSFANTGLTDNTAEPLIGMLESNETLETLNIETNYLSGEFIARLFQAALRQQTLVELRCSNQGPTFSNLAELDIMKAICANESICKVGLTFRSKEARTKVDQAIYRNCEIRRLNRNKQKTQ